MTRLHRRRKFQSPLCPRWSKRCEDKFRDVPGNPCWDKQLVRSLWKEHPFVEWLEKSRESTFHLFWWIIFTVEPVINSQNDRVTTFESDVSEYRRVSTTIRPPSVTVLGIVASKGEKLPPVWLQRGCRLTSVVNRIFTKLKACYEHSRCFFFCPTNLSRSYWEKYWLHENTHEYWCVTLDHHENKKYA